MSCSVLKCGFGRVKNKTILKQSIKSRKNRKTSRNKFKRVSRRIKKSRRSRRTRKASKKKNLKTPPYPGMGGRKFGFKYLRNDQIIRYVNGSYPKNLTCDRA